MVMLQVQHCGPQADSSIFGGFTQIGCGCPAMLLLLCFCRIIVAVFLCVLSSAAAPQSVSFWKVSNGVAHTSILLPEAKKPNTQATLTIEYSIVGGMCRVMVGVAVLSGREYGTRQGNRIIDDIMTVTILGMHQWTAKPLVALYSNGFEAAIPASDQFINELKAGSTVHVRSLPNTPTFEFSLRGSSAAINKASSTCK